MTGHKLHWLFATPLAVAQLRDPAMDAALRDTILARRRKHPGSNHSNLGGWQSDMGLLHWGGNPARSLAREVLALADTVTVDEAQPDRPHNWSLEAWANVNEAGHANLPHSHAGASGCFWSAVYYLTAADGAGGALLFDDPRGPMVGTHGPSLRFRGGTERRLQLAPEAGLLILFPAWLIHSVLPWQGSTPRISIAFNLSAEPRSRGRPVAAAEIRAGDGAAPEGYSAAIPEKASRSARSSN